MADSGMIKWFSNAKGFGFIVNENGALDIFSITVRLSVRATEHLNQVR